ncbi:hypothetical protein PAL_GLEAN10015967 [Pteropus alecto]|uniref:Uncharacterized protein n=1 Tax=Pteropus alecto TaxID=9402 RepID=L5L0Y8_PTEAL|nr:hypothetical protein PAL_GLEAN10015967 [Pteropus alecto]
MTLTDHHHSYRCVRPTHSPDFPPEAGYVKSGNGGRPGPGPASGEESDEEDEVKTSASAEGSGGSATLRNERNLALRNLGGGRGKLLPETEPAKEPRPPAPTLCPT